MIILAFASATISSINCLFHIYPINEYLSVTQSDVMSSCPRLYYLSFHYTGEKVPFDYGQVVDSHHASLTQYRPLFCMETDNKQHQHSCQQPTESDSL